MSSLPPLGTGFSDGLRAGPQVKSGIYTGTPGAPISPFFVYDIVPQPASAVNIAPPAIVNGPTTIAPGSGLVTSGNSGSNKVGLFPSNQQPIVMFDCERAVQVTSIGGGSAVTLTFYGIDILNNFVTKSLSIPAGAAVTVSPWTMLGVFRVYVSGPTTSQISIGCADAFGLPYVAYSQNYLIPYFAGGVGFEPLLLSGTSGALAATGAATVNNAYVAANSLIFTSIHTPSVNAGYISAPSGSIATGTSFGIQSSNAADTSTVNYEIVTPSYSANTTALAAVNGTSQFTVFSPSILPAVSLDPSVFTQAIRLSVNTFLPSAAQAGTLSYVINPAGGSFTVTSSNNADLSTINWQIMNINSEYSGINPLAAGTATIGSPVVVNGETLVFSNYQTNVNPGFLSQGNVVTGSNFVVNSTSNTDTSVVTVFLKNLPNPAQYILPDITSPATINSGNPRGVFIPSSPSDGFSRLTIWMYNRGILNANATLGANPSDPLFANTNANLYGVNQYTDNAH